MLHPPCKPSGPPPCDSGGYGGQAQIFDGKIGKICQPEPENPCAQLSCLQRLTEARNEYHEIMKGGQQASITSASGSVSYFKPTAADKSQLKAYIRELEAECGPVDPCPPARGPCGPCGGPPQQPYSGRGPYVPVLG